MSYRTRSGIQNFVLNMRKLIFGSSPRMTGGVLWQVLRGSLTEHKVFCIIYSIFMRKIIGSVIRSIGTAIKHDPEIKRCIERHPLICGLIKRRLTLE